MRPSLFHGAPAALCVHGSRQATSKTSRIECASHAEGQPPDLAALKPMSAAASAKDRGYKPAPKATSALEEQIAAGRSAATSAGNGVDEDMDAENVAAGGNSAAHDFDAGKQAARINAAMSRPGPAVRAEELSTEENPFAGHVPLEKPSKYRCVAVLWRARAQFTVCGW